MFRVGYREISVLCVDRGSGRAVWREWRIRVAANGSSSARRRAARADVTAR